jgi:hypothetical protein
LKEGGVDDFHRKEDSFSMTQARLRSELRLQAGRAKYVDIIAHNLESDEAVMRPDTKPWRIFENMSYAELEDVRRDIEAVAPAGTTAASAPTPTPTRCTTSCDRVIACSHARSGTHPQFWDDMLALCDDQVAIMNMHREIAEMGGLRGSLAAQKSVKEEAEAFLRQKSCAELLQLKATIESKLRDSGSHDTEFMEEVAPALVPPPPRPHTQPLQVHGRIAVATARARVSEAYAVVLASKQHLTAVASAFQSDAPGGQDADGAAAGGGDAAHNAAAKFIESQRLEKGVGSDEEVRWRWRHAVAVCVGQR